MELTGRVPPQSLEAEQSVLGCMLISAAAVSAACDMLRGEDFYSAAHREIYEAMSGLLMNAKPVDMITVVSELERRGTLEGVGGPAFIAQLTQYMPSAANVQAYIDIVREKSTLRKLIHASQLIMQDSFEASKEVTDILTAAEKAIFDISMGRGDSGFVHVHETMLEVYQQIEQVYRTKIRITGVPSGFADLDNKLAGLHPAELILVGARPSMGKTAFGLNLALSAALEAKQPVAMFNLEMPREQLVSRMLCTHAMVDMQKLRTGELSSDDWARLIAAMSPIAQSPIYIDDTPGITPMEMLSRLRRMKIEKGLGLVVIDYLQLMSMGGKSENRQQEVSAITRSLKLMARELDVPVILLAQLSRGPESRSDHRPMLSDLRESGAIEQDADVVMFLYRDAYYKPDSDKKNIAEIILAKQRNGPTGTVELLWIGEYMRFMNLAHGYDTAPQARPI